MNRMCLDCECLNNDCKGTNNQTWTNCIYRKSDKNNLNSNSVIPIISRETLKEHNVLISKMIEEVNRHEFTKSI